MKRTATHRFTMIQVAAMAMAIPAWLGVAAAVEDDGLGADAPVPAKRVENPAAAADPDQKKRASELELLLEELQDQRPDLTNYRKDEWVGYVATAKETLDPFIKKYGGTEEAARANYKIWEVKKTAKDTEDKDYLFAAADSAQGGTVISVQILVEGAMAAAAEDDYPSADKYAARLQNAHVGKDLELQIFALLGDLALKNPKRDRKSVV